MTEQDEKTDYTREDGLQPGDVFYGEWLIRKNDDDSYTIHRDGFQEGYTTKKGK